MSYILDAIRKSESERRRGEIPDVLAVQTVPLPPQPRSSRGFPLIAAALVVCAATAGAVWWMREEPAPARTVADAAPESEATPRAGHGAKVGNGAPADAVPQAGLRQGTVAAEAPPLTAPPVLVSPPPGTAWALTPVPMAPTPPGVSAKSIAGAWAGEQGETGLSDDEVAVLLENEGVALGAPPRQPTKPRSAEGENRPATKAGQKQEPAWYAAARADLAAMASEERKSGGAAAQAPRAQDQTVALAPAPARAAPPQAAAPKATPVAAPSAAPSIDDLPPAVRNQVPPIELSIHLFASDPSARRVRVNNQSLREGDPVGPDLQVAAITRDGVVFRFKGTEFFLGAGESWQPR